MDQETINILLTVLQVLLVVSALFAVMIRDLLKAAIGLAAMSVVLSIIMFALGSPLAAVFELSICAGLITAVFVSVITLTRMATLEEKMVKTRQHRAKYIYLPILVVLVTGGILLAWPSISLEVANVATGDLSIQADLWDLRPLDLFGQVIIMLAGVFGVVVFFKDRR